MTFQIMSTNNDTITLDSTVNLDDSSVMSSTKNSSVLEVTTNSSVIDISSDSSSDTEDCDEDEVNSTSENVDSTSERMVRESSKEFSTTGFNSEAEEETGGEVTEAWVTTEQSLATEITMDREGDSSLDQSSILSATQLLSDISSNQVKCKLWTQPRFEILSVL